MILRYLRNFDSHTGSRELYNWVSITNKLMHKKIPVIMVQVADYLI